MNAPTGGPVHPSSDPGWFRRPTGNHPGTVNACYAALDRQVILGRSNDLALEERTFAQLVEEVGAMAGALRGWGAGPDAMVLLDVSADREAVLLALACARVGATLVTSATSHRDTVAAALSPAVVASDRDGDGVVVNDVAWALVMKAGRTDPAGCADVLADAPAMVTWTPEGAEARTALQLAVDLAVASERAPFTAAELRRTLGI